MAPSQDLFRLSDEINTCIEDIISSSRYDNFIGPQRLSRQLIDIIVELRLLKTNIRHNKDALDDLALLCPPTARNVRMSLQTLKDLIMDITVLTRYPGHWLSDKLASKGGDFIVGGLYSHQLKYCHGQHQLAIEKLHQ